MIVRMPRLPFGFASIGVYPSLAERKYPFDFPCEFKSEFVATLEIPEGYDVVRMPEDASVTGDVADFELSCDWNEVERTLTWKQAFDLRNRRIPADGYPAFKESHNTMASPKSRLVLLRKSG